ncbi:hypothetical protein MHU86_3674 [Fragilaria crotonensis]|nr:hypothetical protein MHU86_3674 [Fragilaria crotonensis]
MTASSASETHPVVNATTMEFSQVLVDNPVTEIKDDTSPTEDTAASIVVADDSSKKRASPESKDEPEAKKLDVKHETCSNGDNDADQVAIAAAAKEKIVDATNDDGSRANVDIASNDNEILNTTGIETESSLKESECQEESNDIPKEEVKASADNGVVVSIATEDEVECCA